MGTVNSEEAKKLFLIEITNSFPKFCEYSLKYLGFTPGHIQLEMAKFIECGEERIGLFAARGFGKTYLGCSLYICWRFLRIPHLKIKVMSNSFTRSSEITGQCLHFLKTLPWLKHLCPIHKNPSKTKFNIRNSFIEKEPSLQAISVSSINTGGRVDLCIVDDIESEDIDTHDKRQSVLNSAREISSMLHPPHSRPFYSIFKSDLPPPERTQLVALGTYNTTESIYICPEDDSPHFLRGAVIKKYPALNENGNSTFPERFSTEYLINLRDNYFDYTYWCLQFLLDPSKVIGSNCPFKFDKISAHAVDEQKISALYAFIDTSSGTDFTTCVIGGVWNRKLYIHDILYYKDMTSDQSLGIIMDRVKAIQGIQLITVEGNMVPHVHTLKRIAHEKKCNIKIDELRVTGNKHKRVVSTLEPVLHSGDVVLNKKLMHPGHQLMIEMKAWTYSQEPDPKIHDDCTDSLSSFVKIHAEKIGRIPAKMGGYVC